MQPEKKKLYTAIGLAALSALLAWAYLYQRERQLLGAAQEVKVLVAKRYIPATTRLEAGSLAWAHIPAAFVPKGAITDASTVLGMQTLVPFNASEPILYNKLALHGQALAASVPEGKRAVSLPINAVSGVSGLLLPGDHVDAWLRHGQGSASQAGTLLQDVSVLAVGSQTEGGEGGERAANTVTLALSPEEAGLALVAASQGEIYFALRATGDARPLGGTKTLWSDVLRRLDRSPSAVVAPLAAPAAVEDFIPHKR